MLQKKPSYIASMSIASAPIKYKWSDDISCGFDEVENDKLYDAIDSVSFKAKMAVGALITEWVAWRLEGHTDLTDALNRVEAAWASAIDSAYAKALTFDLSDDDDFQDKFVIEGTLETALDLLESIHVRYQQGDVYLAQPVMKQAMLARHVISQKKAFSDWLSNMLYCTEEVFPRDAEYDEETGLYDASHEKPVFREFFEPSFVYNDGSAKIAINEFLQTLDYNQNPYLLTPEEMTAEGFKDTPYTY